MGLINQNIENAKALTYPLPLLTTQSKPFLLGFANSMFQASGFYCGDTNWTSAAEKGSVISVSLGQCISHWLNFEDDLDKMVEFGVNSYRFSIEWSHIEPEQGVYDHAVLARYDAMIAECLARNIKPMLTLYHFNEPNWFTKLHGFEKEENIDYFVSFCEMIFKRYGKHVNYWCTFNEPAVQAFSSYFYGQFPPHHHNLSKTIHFLLNLIKAHARVYKQLKQLPFGDKAQIGLVHNVLRFKPRYKWEPISAVIPSFVSHLLNDLVLEFLKTGHFEYKIKFLLNVNYKDETIAHSYDFIGLNFYGNPIIGFNKRNFFGPTHFPNQIMGTFHLPIDAEGFEKAIDEVALLGKPIIITETGFATDDDRLRVQCLQSYFAVVEKKLNEKVDIQGLYLWTFADNYEWDRGHTIKFGVCDQFRVERKSALEFKAFIQSIQTKQKNEVK